MTYHNDFTLPAELLEQVQEQVLDGMLRICGRTGEVPVHL